MGATVKVYQVNCKEVIRVVQTLYDESGERRVILFQREDGSFGFDEEHLAKEGEVSYWIPAYGRTVCFADTLERFCEKSTEDPWLNNSEEDRDEFE